MIKIAALACANGLGHVRRVVAISTFILKNGFNGSIDLFIPYCHVMTLKNWPDMNFGFKLIFQTYKCMILFGVIILSIF